MDMKSPASMHELVPGNKMSDARSGNIPERSQSCIGFCISLFCSLVHTLQQVLQNHTGHTTYR